MSAYSNQHVASKTSEFTLTWPYPVNKDFSLDFADIEKKFQWRVSFVSFFFCVFLDVYFNVLAGFKI